MATFCEWGAPVLAHMMVSCIIQNHTEVQGGSPQVAAARAAAALKVRNPGGPQACCSILLLSAPH